VPAEGWFADPFGHHEARWISDGAPTALVRDAGTESQEPPPDGAFSGHFQPLVETPTKDDNLQADAAELQDHDPGTLIRASYYPPAASMVRFLKQNPNATSLEAIAHAATPSSPHPGGETRG
jgi:hypothetical protein